MNSYQSSSFDRIFQVWSPRAQTSQAMNESSCPICFTALEVADVAPCMECGHLPQEIEHALSGKHSCAEMRIFGDLTLVLCNFCQVDFGSIDPQYFGLPKNSVIGFQKVQFVRNVMETGVTRDKVCPNCNHRSRFLRFVQAARELNSDGESSKMNG